MSDKELIMEIFKRFDDVSFNSGNPMVAETDSEVAADALTETLYNIGLMDVVCYRTDGEDEKGHWIARFEIQ